MKIGDLGDAIQERDEESYSATSPITLGTEGTLAFFSPERAAGAAYGVGADVWALGVALVAVWTGRLPSRPRRRNLRRPARDASGNLMVSSLRRRRPQTSSPSPPVEPGTKG